MDSFVVAPLPVIRLNATKVTEMEDLGPYGRGDSGADTRDMTPMPPTTTRDETDFRNGTHPGDLARRVTHRRVELGLTTQELAKRAGVDAWFLAYFEQSSDTTLQGGALLRLAV